MMLGPVLTVWDFKHTRHAQQRLLGVPVCYHLQERKKKRRWSEGTQNREPSLSEQTEQNNVLFYLYFSEQDKPKNIPLFLFFF